MSKNTHPPKSPRNPKGPKLTPDQEEQLSLSERLLIRADIMTAGVGKLLQDHEYCGVELLSESATVLLEAADWRRRAYKIRDEATKGNDPAFIRAARRRARR